MKCDPDVSNERFWDRFGWLVAGVWIVFLIFPVLELINGDYSTATRVVGLLLLAAFAGIYLRAYAVNSRCVGQGGTKEFQAYVYFALLWLIVLAGIPVTGLTMMGMFPFLTSYAAFLLTRPFTIGTYSVVSILCVGLPLYFGATVDNIFLIGLNVVLMVVYVITVAAITRAGVSEKIRAEYLVVAEQERMARDVHDGIGHSLTALNLKAQLAMRLMDAGKYLQAREELEQLSGLAVNALDSVRTTVHGLSRQDLAPELAELHRSCADNNLRFTVIGTVEDIPVPWRSHVAWILREAVTNVLRHAHASSVVLTLTPDGITVDDDGDGFQVTVLGHGIRGMQERARLFGARCTVGASALGGACVDVIFSEEDNND